MMVKLYLFSAVALLILLPSFTAHEDDHKDQQDEGPPPTNEDEHHPDGNEHHPDGNEPRPKQNGGHRKGGPWGKRGDHDHDHDHDEKDGPLGHGGRDRRRGGHDNMWIRRSCKIRAVIIAGVLIFVMLLVFIVFCIYRKQKVPKKTEVKTIPKVFIEPSPNNITITKPMKKLVNEA